jgi:hypothetical protein
MSKVNENAMFKILMFAKSLNLDILKRSILFKREGGDPAAAGKKGGGVMRKSC